MRARIGNRMPAVRIVAGLLILAVTVGVLQAVGATSANADRHTVAKRSDLSAPRPVFASIARAGSDRSTGGEAIRNAERAASCKPTTAVAARAGRRAERPEFFVHRHAALALAGRTVAIRGRLKDACAGVRVRLQQRSGHGWRALASARVSRHGHFALTYQAPEAGTAGLRVAFKGGHGLHATTASVGAVTAMHPAVASWYYDYPQLGDACGFHAAYGIANKTLPCGTKVTLSYRGRTVVATVDDRGPYIAGRDYDLGLSTQRALGMTDGVVTLLASS
jgi:rare lipoprotein A